MNKADVAKLLTDAIIATAFVVAAALHAIPWLVALGAIVLVLKPSSLPEVAKWLTSRIKKDDAPPSGASVIDPSEDESK